VVRAGIRVGIGIGIGVGVGARAGIRAGELDEQERHVVAQLRSGPLPDLAHEVGQGGVE
jgi:hypothetical protein